MEIEKMDGDGNITQRDSVETVAPSLSLFKKICFSAIITGMIFASAEGILRISGFGFTPQFSIYAETRWTRHGVGQDPTLPWSWMPIPGATCFVDKRSAFQFNSLGYRGPLFQPEKAMGVVRIVCMGDSGTMGWAVKDDETYCAQLKHFLESRCNKKVETINAGVFGYTSFQGLHQLQTRILDLQPDFITVCYNWNDHAPAIRIAKSSGKAAWEQGLPQTDKDLPGPNLLSNFERGLSSLRLFQLVQYGFIHFHTGRKGNQQIASARAELARVPLMDYKQNLAAMISLAREHHCTAILLTQALNPKTRHFRQEHQSYNTAVVEIAEKMKVPYVDPRELLEDDPALFSSNTHPRREGHRRIAVALADTIGTLAGCERQ